MATPGLDLTYEGWSQCYGWKNSGPIAPRHGTMTKYCGNYGKIKFAGWRCGVKQTRANLVEHDVHLDSKRMKFGVWLRSKRVNRGDGRMSNVDGHNKGTKKAAKYNWYAKLRQALALPHGFHTRSTCHAGAAAKQRACSMRPTCTLLDGSASVTTRVPRHHHRRGGKHPACVHSG